MSAPPRKESRVNANIFCHLSLEGLLHDVFEPLLRGDLAAQDLAHPEDNGKLEIAPETAQSTGV